MRKRGERMREDEEEDYSKHIAYRFAKKLFPVWPKNVSGVPNAISAMGKCLPGQAVALMSEWPMILSLSMPYSALSCTILDMVYS